MREILFRVWDPELDNGRMLYFDSFEEIVDWQNWDEWKLENSAMRSVDYMQYTGLDDKNGVKIFEGDVCKLILNKVFVEFTSGSFKFRRIDKNDVFFPVCEFTVNQCHPEVIGNIHDNPELLEEKK